MARRLMNLRIDEISTVDKGAGRGATVELVKHERGVTKMNLQEIIAKSSELQGAGLLSPYVLAIAHQERAKELGISLQKYYDSDEGKKALKRATTFAYFETQRVAPGNGHPALNEFNKSRPKVEMADPAERARKCAAKIAAYQKAGMSYLEAASKAHRDEQALASGDAEADDQRHNTGEWNDSLGERVNSGAPEATQRRPTGLGSRR
jgi:hypothetical protein